MSSLSRLQAQSARRRLRQRGIYIELKDATTNDEPTEILAVVSPGRGGEELTDGGFQFEHQAVARWLRIGDDRRPKVGWLVGVPVEVAPGVANYDEDADLRWYRIMELNRTPNSVEWVVGLEEL